MTMVTAYPTSVTQTGGVGFTSWNTPANAQGTPDAVTTSCESFSAAKTLSCTGFGFSIPSGATIDGFVIHVIGNSVAEPIDCTINIYEGGGSSIGGGVVENLADFGTSSNSQGLTVANVNNLKITLAIGSTGDFSTVEIDAIQVDVYYTAAGGTTTETGRTRGRAFGRAR